MTLVIHEAPLVLEIAVDEEGELIRLRYLGDSGSGVLLTKEMFDQLASLADEFWKGVKNDG